MERSRWKEQSLSQGQEQEAGGRRQEAEADGRRQTAGGSESEGEQNVHLPPAPAACRLVIIIRIPCFGLSVITGLSATG
jgi:hypothetical protein